MSNMTFRQLLCLSLLTSLLTVFFISVGSQLIERPSYADDAALISANDHDISQLENIARGFRKVAQDANPSVVFIEISSGQLAEELLEQEMAREERLNPRMSDAQRHQLRESLRQRGPGSGSGVIISKDGYILSNNHVVGNRDAITVHLADGRKCPATLVGADPKTDLAVIKIDAPDLVACPFGNSNTIQVGDWVLAVGAPFGLSQTVTHGIVSAKGRSGIDLSIAYQDFIQTDAAINPGNSGGPLLNLHSEIVGINTAIVSQNNRSSSGIGFAIPSNFAQQIAQRLIEHGEITRGWLGIGISPVNKAEAEIFGLERPAGILVDGVMKNSAAANAGLQIEDVITTVDGIPITGLKQYQQTITELQPGDAITLSIVRSGKPMKLTLTVDKQPDIIRDLEADEALWHIKELGRYVRTITPTLRQRFMFPEDARGVLVLYAPKHDDDPAPGLEAADLIIGCNDEPVTTVRDLMFILKKTQFNKRIELHLKSQFGDEAKLYIRRN